MIDAKAFKELISEVTALLRVSDRLLARSCNISSSTLRRWQTDGISQRTSRSDAYRNFEAYVRNDHKTIAVNEIGRVPTPVDPEVSQRIVDLYEQCMKTSDSAPAALPQQISNALDEQNGKADSRLDEQHSEDILTRFGTISVYANLIRWRKKGVSSIPFETKVIGMDELQGTHDIYDEMILYTHNTIIETRARTLKINLLTSGTIELTHIGEQDFSVDKEIFEKTNGVMLPINLQLGQSQNVINYIRKVYNGFQQGHEELALRLPDNSTASRIEITLDFSEITNYAVFLEEPRAEYAILDRTMPPESVPVFSKNDGAVWYTSYDEPQQGYRLLMKWALKEGSP